MLSLWFRDCRTTCSIVIIGDAIPDKGSVSTTRTSLDDFCDLTIEDSIFTIVRVLSDGSTSILSKRYDNYIQIPKGTYFLEKPITIPRSNVRVNFNSINLIFAPGDYNGLINYTINNDCVSDLKPKVGLKLKDLKIGKRYVRVCNSINKEYHFTLFAIGKQEMLIKYDDNKEAEWIYLADCGIIPYIDCNRWNIVNYIKEEK